MMRVQVLEEMQAQGHRPDVGVYNVVIEALSRSGVLLLQLKAAQLFQAAVRQGQLRCAPVAPCLPVNRLSRLCMASLSLQTAVCQGQLQSLGHALAQWTLLTIHQQL